MHKIDPSLPFQTLWQYIRHTLVPYKRIFALYIFVAIVIPIYASAMNYIFKYIVDAAEAKNTQLVFTLGILIPVVYFGLSMLHRFDGYLAMRFFSEKAKRDIDMLFAHIIGQSHSYFSNRFSGGVQTKARALTHNSFSLIRDATDNYLSSFVMLLTTVILVSTVNVLAGIVFIVFGFVLVLVNTLLVSGTRKLAMKQGKAGAAQGGGMVDAFTNMSTVRLFARGAYEKDRIGGLTANYRDAIQALWRRNLFSNTLNAVIILAFSLLAFYIIGLGWSQGAVSTGEFVLVITLTWSLMNGLVFIGRAMHQTASQLGEMKEAFDDLFVPNDITDVEGAKQLSVQEGVIAFNAVSFSHEETAVFDDFSLTIAPGTRVGLVGQSGAGKSTFVSLLLRDHDVTQGSVAIDGQDIRQVTQDSLREAIALVPQESTLFHRSIFDNVAYGKPGASHDDVVAAAKKAYIHDYIMSLPKGYETEVGERGVKLSGGQRQRVAIARAILKDAPILILDEATSALDSESEVFIQKALHELMRGKTVIAIAHRLSTLREMDRIIVLDAGKITEDGTHAVLANNGGTYQRLWDHQAGGFVQE